MVDIFSDLEIVDYDILDEIKWTITVYGPINPKIYFCDVDPFRDNSEVQY